MRVMLMIKGDPQPGAAPSAAHLPASRIVASLVQLATGPGSVSSWSSSLSPPQARPSFSAPTWAGSCAQPRGLVGYEPERGARSHRPTLPHRADTAPGQGGRDGQALAMQTRTPPLAAPPWLRRQSVSRVPRLRKATGLERYRRSPAPGHCVGREAERPDKYRCSVRAGRTSVAFTLDRYGHLFPATMTGWRPAGRHARSGPAGRSWWGGGGAAGGSVAACRGRSAAHGEASNQEGPPWERAWAGPMGVRGQGLEARTVALTVVC